MTIEVAPAGVDRPTFYAAQGRFALAAGDTRAARAYHRAAAAALAAEMAALFPPRRRHLLRLQVATQYFKAGDYRRAKRLAAQIDGRHVPSPLRPVLEQFLSDCAVRTKPGYRERVLAAIAACRPPGQFGRALELLAAHPYVQSMGGVAFMRAVTAEEIGEYEYAAVNYGIAVRELGGGRFLFSAAAIPLRLIEAGRFAEAAEYTRLLAEEIRHPHVTASRALVAANWLRGRTGPPPEDPRSLAGEQLTLTDEALAAWRSLPPAERDHPTMTEYLALALVHAARAATNWFSDAARARAYFEAAKPLDRRGNLRLNEPKIWAPVLAVTADDNGGGQPVEILDDSVRRLAAAVASESGTNLKTFLNTPNVALEIEQEVTPDTAA